MNSFLKISHSYVCAVSKERHRSLLGGEKANAMGFSKLKAMAQEKINQAITSLRSFSDDCGLSTFESMKDSYVSDDTFRQLSPKLESKT